VLHVVIASKIATHGRESDIDGRWRRCALQRVRVQEIMDASRVRVGQWVRLHEIVTSATKSVETVENNDFVAKPREDLLQSGMHKRIGQVESGSVEGRLIFSWESGRDGSFLIWKVSLACSCSIAVSDAT
jgi:hypothetical protein